MYLTHRIKIKIISFMKFFIEHVSIWSHITECIDDYLLLFFSVMSVVDELFVRLENIDNSHSVSRYRVDKSLSSWNSTTHTLVREIEDIISCVGRYVVSHKMLELFLFSEYESPHTRVKSISPDNKIEFFTATFSIDHAYSILILKYLLYRIPKNVSNTIRGYGIMYY